MKIFYVVLALCAGALMPIQAGVNAKLRLYLGDAVWAAFVSFGVGTLALMAYGLACRVPWLGAASAVQAPWWSWLGGFMGAFFVTATILLAAKIGAASMTAWLIAAQLIASLVLDHYGAIGYAVREITWPRALGASMLAAGAVLMQRY